MVVCGMKYFITSLFVLGFFSCNHSKSQFEQAVLKKIDSCDSQIPCVFHLYNDLGIEFDSAVTFSTAVGLGEVNEILGFELLNYTDIGNRIVFIRNGKVVYYQEWFPYFEDKKVVLEFPSDSGYTVAKPDNCKYILKIIDDNEVKNISLTYMDMVE